MIFVVEGPDRVGKSTLLNSLSREFSLPIIMVERPAENGWDAYDEWVQGKKDFENIALQYFSHEKHYFMDRFSYSELVYTKIFNRKCDREWYITRLQEAHRNKYLKLIIAKESPWELRKRWKAENLPVENVQPLLDEYHALPMRLGLHFKDYVTVRPSNEGSVNYLKEWIREISLRPTD